MTGQTDILYKKCTLGTDYFHAFVGGMVVCNHLHETAKAASICAKRWIRTHNESTSLDSFCEELESLTKTYYSQYPTGLADWRKGRCLLEAYRLIKAKNKIKSGNKAF